MKTETVPKRRKKAPSETEGALPTASIIPRVGAAGPPSRATRVPRGGPSRGSHLHRALTAFGLDRLEELRSRLRFVSMVEMEPGDGSSVANGLADGGRRYVQGARGGRVAVEGLAGFQATMGLVFECRSLKNSGPGFGSSP